MYISKNELIRRLVKLTGKDRNEFASKTVKELSLFYENYSFDGEITYIEVPYEDKNIVKLLGARYDGKKKKWYIPQGVDTNIFSNWL